MSRPLKELITIARQNQLSGLELLDYFTLDEMAPKHFSFTVV